MEKTKHCTTTTTTVEYYVKMANEDWKPENKVKIIYIFGYTLKTQVCIRILL